MQASIDKATGNMRKLASMKPTMETVRIRSSFVRLAEPLDGAFSDRSVPPRRLRPPSTRLMTSTGAALRLFLTALFEAQTSASRPGTRPSNNRRLSGEHNQINWVDLLATWAQDSYGNVHLDVPAKKRRQLNDTLKRLRDDDLVALPNGDAGANKCEGFLLRDEGGERAQGPNELYRLPGPKERDTFDVPITLFTEGWIHCLEDTELAFILMLASAGAWTNVAKISGNSRLRSYCFSRDAYDAHILLNRLGMLTVYPDPDRHADGKVERYKERGEAHLHRFELKAEALNAPAFPAVTAAIAEALEQKDD